MMNTAEGSVINMELASVTSLWVIVGTVTTVIILLVLLISSWYILKSGMMKKIVGK